MELNQMYDRREVHLKALKSWREQSGHALQAGDYQILAVALSQAAISAAKIAAWDEEISILMGIESPSPGGHRATPEAQAHQDNQLAGHRPRTPDSPRWCESCGEYGDHHTDRHPESPPKALSQDGGDRGRAQVIHTDDPPTEAQLEFIEDLKQQLGEDTPPKLLQFDPTTRIAASQFINAFKAQLGIR